MSAYTENGRTMHNDVPSAVILILHLASMSACDSKTSVREDPITTPGFTISATTDTGGEVSTAEVLSAAASAIAVGSEVPVPKNCRLSAMDPVEFDDDGEPYPPTRRFYSLKTIEQIVLFQALTEQGTMEEVKARLNNKAFWLERYQERMADKVAHQAAILSRVKGAFALCNADMRAFNYYTLTGTDAVETATSLPDLKRKLGYDINTFANVSTFSMENMIPDKVAFRADFAKIPAVKDAKADLDRELAEITEQYNNLILERREAIAAGQNYNELTERIFLLSDMKREIESFIEIYSVVPEYLLERFKSLLEDDGVRVWLAAYAVYGTDVVTWAKVINRSRDDCRSAALDAFEEIGRINDLYPEILVIAGQVGASEPTLIGVQGDAVIAATGRSRRVGIGFIEIFPERTVTADGEIQGKKLWTLVQEALDMPNTDGGRPTSRENEGFYCD